MALRNIINCSTGAVSTVTVVDDPPFIPAAVAPQQLRQALRKAGLKTAFEAHVALQSEAEQEAWKHGRRIHRTGTLITGAITAAVLTTAQADAAFADALNHND